MNYGAVLPPSVMVIFNLTTNFTHIQKFQKNGVFVVNCHEPPSCILGERRIAPMISRTFRSRIFHSCSHPASFLVCWLPFFTCNILDAISIKFSLNTAPGNFAFQVLPFIIPPYSHLFSPIIIFLTYDSLISSSFHIITGHYTAWLP